jgi:hypothetical protein
MYRRGRPPVLLNIRNAGVEGQPYTFIDAYGKANYDIETEAFGPVDEKAAPIMVNVNSTQGDVNLTEEEARNLLTFVAFQAVRTAVFRDMCCYDLTESF